MLTSDALLMRHSDSPILGWDDGARMIVPFVPGVTLSMQFPGGFRKPEGDSCEGEEDDVG